jgi:transcriptional regulator GlxA family with amidase domain
MAKNTIVLATAASSMQTIIFLLVPNMLATSVTLPVEMLRAAWAMAKVKSPKLPPIAIEYRSEAGAIVQTHTGFELPTIPLKAPIKPNNLIFLPALWRNPSKVIEHQMHICTWLKDVSLHSTIAAVGTGVCFLAEAGLLDYRPATTHWHYFEQFSKRYPKVMLKRDHFITRSHRIFCTASINALAELTAFFIQEQFGQRIAQAVERNFFHEIRQSRTQAWLNPATPVTTNELVALAVAKLDEHIARASGSAYDSNVDNSGGIGVLAKSLNTSVRSLNRHFKVAVGISPLQYVQQKRLLLAEELLKTSNLGIAELANLAGFQDAQHFGRLFKKHYGIAPRDYRLTVRSKPYS